MVAYCKSETEWVVGILATLSLVVISIPVFTRKDYSLFEPLTFVLMLVAFGTTLKALYIISQTADNYYVVRRLLIFQSLESLVFGMSIIAVGWVFFVVGYSLPVKSKSLSFIYLPSVKQWHGKRLQVFLILLSIFSIVCLAAFMVSAGVSFADADSLSAKRFSQEAGSAQKRLFNISYYLYRGAAFSKFVCYFTLLWILQKRQSLLSWVGLWFIFSLLQTCFLSFVLSNRAGIVLLLIDCMVLSYYMRQQLNFRKIGFAVAAVAVVLLPMLIVRSTQDLTVMTSLEKTMAGRDMLDISKTCHIINAVPAKIGYQENGGMLWAWMTAPIPRSMWHNKPLWIERNVLLNQKVFGDKAGIAGMPPGMVSEFYWNFGTAGIWIGLFFTGFVFRQIYVMFEDFQSNPTSVLIYTFIVTRFCMFTFGNDFGSGILKALIDILPVLLVIWYIRTHQPASELNQQSSVEPSVMDNGENADSRVRSLQTT